MGMYLPKRDEQYLGDNRKEILFAMSKYRELTGVGWSPYNRDQSNKYGSAENRHKALLEAITEAENNQTS